MVFYFLSTTGILIKIFNYFNKGYMIYMGRDKYENEELLKYGWPEDIWFHVDDVSSAHVYVRLNKGETYLDMPE